MQLVNSSKNPEIAMQNILNQNPQMKSVVDEAKKTGRSVKDVFYIIAKNKGVNPDEIIAMLK